MDQRISLITLGVADTARARRFYEAGLGWRPSSPSNDEVAFYQTGGLIVGLGALVAALPRRRPTPAELPFETTPVEEAV